MKRPETSNTSRGGIFPPNLLAAANAAYGATGRRPPNHQANHQWPERECNNWGRPIILVKTAAGWHAFLATITAAGHRRYIYATELIQVLPSQTVPALAIRSLGLDTFQVTVTAQPGQTVTLQTSANLSSWQPLATNTLMGTTWLYTNSPVPAARSQFYRALLSQ